MDYIVMATISQHKAKLIVELKSIRPLKHGDLRIQVESYIDEEYYGLTKEQRKYHILGGVHALLEYNIISQDDYYDVVELINKVDNINSYNET